MISSSFLLFFNSSVVYSTFPHDCCHRLQQNLIFSIVLLRFVCTRPQTKKTVCTVHLNWLMPFFLFKTYFLHERWVFNFKCLSEEEHRILSLDNFRCVPFKLLLSYSIKTFQYNNFNWKVIAYPKLLSVYSISVHSVEVYLQYRLQLCLNVFKKDFGGEVMHGNHR